ncbi:MAG: DUF3127 domain-containing protein [Bacteroidetes bacterium]|nr:DUF3127 domain-containing protein [Bacteroidota bacterium]MBP7400500.1 DUF3127 domain-containing protein [Chitinophagales bacterium]MBK7109400.1 DUF3127 domain-containing protein [Bacteroidota bacterium]MBK8487862.1 DUF3127 domain-containing protein [Bacteroidota bacterium]MBK8682382.1 DUF3127 domain-containing protein [Bacteroidota bacterium]
MSFELQGKLLEIYNTAEISATFKKREFVLERSESNVGRIFTDTIKFQLIQDKCQLLDSFQIGDEVKVSFNIKGTKWEKEGRVNYFNNLDAWRIEKVTGESQAEDITTFSADPQTPYTDDLPF